MLNRVQCKGTVAYLGGLLAVPEPFCWDWGQMREFNTAFMCGPDESLYYTRTTFSLHAHARNDLAQQMLGDWVWMTDTDHRFEPDVVFKMVQLMEQYKTPVLSGVYRHKVLPFHPNLYVWNDNDGGGFVPLIEYDSSVPCFRVDAAGGGCLLVHRSVFARLKKAYPDTGPFNHIGHYGEDLSFFLRCREQGIPVYATPHVETTHLRLHGITEHDYVPAWWGESQDITVLVPGGV